MKPKSRPAAKPKLNATEMEVLMRKVGAATCEAVAVVHITVRAAVRAAASTVTR